MKNQHKLTDTHKHFLRLIVKDADVDGWASVSKAVFPLVEQMPSALVELEMVGDEGRGRVRLTEEGESVITALAWM